MHGQKSWNGVAILSKRPMEPTPGLPGDETDGQSRYIEAVVTTEGAPVRICCLYLPNGNPPETEKYGYKLAWMDRLHARARALLAYEEPLVMAGDYNVIPGPEDVYEPANWLGDALYLPRTRERYRALINLGLTDALRATTDEAGLYTFWDYQGRRLAAEQGHPHRSPAAVAAGGRPARRRHHRQGQARRGQALGPCPDPRRAGALNAAIDGGDLIVLERYRG